MDMLEWLGQMIKSPRKRAIPVLSFPSIQPMGINVRQLISDSDKLAEGMKYIADHTDAGASMSMMDLSLEAECFGSNIRFSDNEVPTVVGGIISSMDEAKKLAVPPVGAGRTGIYIEALEKASRMIKDRPVFAGVIGPFSLSGRLMDVTEALVYCYEEPDMVHTVLGKVTEFLVEYIKAYKTTGANGVVIAEPLAGLLSPALAEKFSSRYVKQIVDAVQERNFIVIYHNCGGSTVDIIDSILSTGASAYHFGNVIKMSDMLPHISSGTVVMGNIDPAGQFRNGTPESIREATLALLDECGKYTNFVISSGCDIPPMSKWENIQSFFGAVKEFYDRQ